MSHLRLIRSYEPKFYLVNSDNFEDAVLDAAAYRELTLQMSSGDFGAHTAELLLNPTDDQLNSAMYFDPEEQVFLPY